MMAQSHLDSKDEIGHLLAKERYPRVTSYQNSDTALFRIRRQNRESQQRYRRRHKKGWEEQILDIADTYQSQPSMDQVWSSPSTSNPIPWSDDRVVNDSST
ncbi:hypothetical protein EJ08DRAFT_520506 [Tothia fuscella]|uniref:Uncharacterized protein n=1 Tax=Tothia fuscella TaxID=1048955 RepID=A0A9P4NH69_9PEZI|nr:hypothetical protein EJ08DRAFT_520506 [Tothia fuscella]